MPIHEENTRPAYLDIDGQQWPGSQIFLGDVRFDGVLIYPLRLENGIELHDSGDPTAQTFLIQSNSTPDSQVQFVLPASGGTLITGNTSNLFVGPNEFSGASAILTIGTGALLHFTYDSGAGVATLWDVLDTNMSETLSIKTPPLVSSARVQSLQDASGVLALLPFAGGTPVVGNGADPPASGAIGKVSRTAQAAAIAATNLTDTTTAGLYEVSYYASCTAANAIDGTIGLRLAYTDLVGATTQSAVGTLSLAATSTGTTALKGTMVVHLASGNLTYETILVGGQTTSRYSLEVRTKYLG